jgi:RNA polymerase sigma-70 factor (ECF subfamily)
MQPWGVLPGVRGMGNGVEAEPATPGRWVRAGPEGAFDQFYETTRARVVSHVFAMCGDLREAQECTQEAYLRAWQRWDRLAGYDDQAAWVRKVATRLAISRWHRSRTAVAAWALRRPPRSEPAVDASAVEVTRALAALPAAQRATLVLHYLAGKSVEEIAAESGVPAGTVKARLARGRRRLEELLEERQ